MKSRRRNILRVRPLLLLLAWGAAGATLNVAVAWGFALQTQQSTIEFTREMILQRSFGVTARHEILRNDLDRMQATNQLDTWIGWPMHSISWPQSDLRSLGMFASTPIWPGFAVNTLFYAGVLWVLSCGPFALRRMIRKRRGQCTHCAYPIGTSDVCTECGAAHAVTPKS